MYRWVSFRAETGLWGLTFFLIFCLFVFKGWLIWSAQRSVLVSLEWYLSVACLWADRAEAGTPIVSARPCCLTHPYSHSVSVSVSVSMCVRVCVRVWLCVSCYDHISVTVLLNETPCANKRTTQLSQKTNITHVLVSWNMFVALVAHTMSKAFSNISWLSQRLWEVTVLFFILTQGYSIADSF